MMLKFKYTIIGLTIFFLWTTLGCGDQKSRKPDFTKDELMWLKIHREIKMAPFPSYHPAEFIDENGDYQGIAADYLRIIQKKTGMQIRFVNTQNWTDTLEQLKEKKIDLIALASRAIGREEFALYSKPYLVFPMVILTSKDIKTKLTPKKLAYKKTAVVEGYAAHKYLKLNYPRITIHSVKNEIEGLRKTSFGEVFAFITDLSSASYYIDKEGINNLRVNNELGYKYKLGYLIRKDWPLLQSILNKSLDSIPKYQKKEIFNKWVSLRLESPLFTKSFLLSSLAISIILILIILFFISRNKNLRYRLNIETLERELSQKKAQQSESENLNKTRFLANMSHEIRTPLNAIIGFSKLIEQSELTKESQINLQYIKTSSKLLLSLINDILDLSKIEAGQMDLVEDECELHPLLEELSGIAEILIKESGKHIQLIQTYDDSINMVMKLDAMRLRQILVNLISNAVKFTPKGEIKLTFVKNPKKNVVIFSVQDTGIGISVTDKSKLFKEFSQVNSENSRNQGGSGLGLAITKKLVEMMDGKIWLESNVGEDRGTKISFSLPSKGSSKEKKSGYQSDQQRFSPEDLTLLADKKILIVEDNSINRLLITTILKKFTRHLFEAENGKIGIDILLENPEIDLVLMDIQMPVMDGIRATEKITKLKKKHLLTDLPIIAVSANSLKSEKEEAIEAGCVDYLTKPLNANQLIYKLIRHLQSTRPR